MKKNFLLLFVSILLPVYMTQATVNSNVVRVVGGDLSLVPAYEAAGDKWLDADNHVINTYYSDGMITYLRDVAGWTAVRCRLLVDPSQDSYVATCQDLDYVKRLGKRVKDAGMYFLLDIFYSDTWTDVSQQWIPNGWGYNRNTATATVAAKVKSYTTEVLNTLTTYGAQPDYVQIGNEVSYGMLWDSMSGKKTSNAFYTSGSYNNYSTQISRFATLLKSAAEGVRAATNGANIKIVLHSERTANSSHTSNFYTWVETAGFTDYDVIGLSYYPTWHGTLSQLTSTLNSLQNSWPNKEIQIVETGYYYSAPDTPPYNTSGTWSFSTSGQASFLNDLTLTLNNYPNVTGLYYWQPEECGNGANSNGVSQVMDSWDNRGFWECSWKSGSHTLNSESALMTLKNFNHTALGETPSGDDNEITTDISNLFTNLDFEDCLYNNTDGYYSDCPGWTIGWDASNWFSDGPWPKAKNEWHSSLCAGTLLQGWKGAGNIVAGNIISQSISNLPAGKYTVCAVVHCDYDGLFLFANDNQTKVSSTTTWGDALLTTVETELTATGTLNIGLTLPTAATITGEMNLYCDNFIVMQTISSNAPIEERDSLYWYEGIKYVYRENGEAYVAGYFGDDLPNEGVELLSEFTVDNVTYYPSWIEAWAMEDFPLSWIVLPESISNIGEGSFYKSALTDVTLHSQYVNIWDYAFTGWDDTLENLGSKGTPLNTFTIYASNMGNVSISPNAFNSNDIAQATLWVVKGLQTESLYSSLGFQHVYPMGTITVKDIPTLIQHLLAGGSGSLQNISDLLNLLLNQE